MVVQILAASAIMAFAVLAGIGYQETRNRVVHRRSWIWVRNIVHTLLWPVRVAYVVLTGRPFWRHVDIKMANKTMRCLGWRDPKWVGGDPD